ncbi:hypothetical protein PISMIDRAFT_14616 [Pisolithus microcarpus 441]|uniref:Myosin motor domain-containing protein n=1 Tax=Pisolithus microcarpus 441 TaxID=765257 RepID=A0A0C9Z6M3_9AGAM|nr:hypothetical protein PISMIDRAFT_14616 [Pisolithus microcarpus 441]
MSHSPALSDLPVEDDWDPRVDQAMGHSELGIAVRSGALKYETHSNVLTHRLGWRSGWLAYLQVNEEGSDTELEREEANFVLEAVHAQCNVCILEQQLAAVKVDETIALGNLYQFRAQTAERPSPEHSAGARPNAIRADDAHQFEQLKVALKTVGLSKQHAIQACQVVAAILHLGNLKFTIDHSRDVDATVMHNVDTLALVAESLGVQPSALENTLSYKTKLVKKELFTVFLDSDGASDNRNDLAKTLYSLLFTWLNKHINQCLCRDDFNTFISLFDLPGPQNMTGRSNSLDQFCINFANE